MAGTVSFTLLESPGHNYSVLNYYNRKLELLFYIFLDRRKECKESDLLLS